MRTSWYSFSSPALSLHDRCCPDDDHIQGLCRQHGTTVTETPFDQRLRERFSITLISSKNASSLRAAFFPP